MFVDNDFGDDFDEEEEEEEDASKQVKKNEIFENNRQGKEQQA